MEKAQPAGPGEDAHMDLSSEVLAGTGSADGAAGGKQLDKLM